jgi:16S rRNA (cytidine1402-2'-O)-methyltransferase
LCLAVNITQPDALIRTRTVREWRSAVPVLGKRPAVFVLGT